MGKEKNVSETAHIYYQTVREELLFHLEQRNQVIFWYLVALTTALGLGLGKGNFYIIFFIPLFSFGASLLVIQHDVHIGSLAAYCSNELDVSLKLAGIVQWDKSKSWQLFYPHFLNLRLFAHIFLVLLPGILSFAYVTVKLWNELFSDPVLIIWSIINLIALFATFFLYLWAKKFRKQIEQVPKNNAKKNGKNK